MTVINHLLTSFEGAVARLQNALEQPKNEFIRDSAIQRFEIAFELSWKSLKAYLEDQHGIVCRSPKSCFREAYRQQLIGYDNRWLEMTDMRNQIAHTYDEAFAERIYGKLPEMLELFEALLARIKHS